MNSTPPRNTEPSLPDIVYVYLEADDEAPYLLANERISDIEDGTVVGIYRLQQTRIKRTTHVLKANDGK